MTENGEISLHIALCAVTSTYRDRWLNRCWSPLVSLRQDLSGPSTPIKKIIAYSLISIWIAQVDLWHSPSSLLIAISASHICQMSKGNFSVVQIKFWSSCALYTCDSLISQCCSSNSHIFESWIDESNPLYKLWNDYIFPLFGHFSRSFQGDLV